MLTVSHSEITCRLAFDMGREAKTYDVIVFASTYEEANCEVTPDPANPDVYPCQFLFIDADYLP